MNRGLTGACASSLLHAASTQVLKHYCTTTDIMGCAFHVMHCCTSLHFKQKAASQPRRIGIGTSISLFGPSRLASTLADTTTDHCYTNCKALLQESYWRPPPPSAFPHHSCQQSAVVRRCVNTSCFSLVSYQPSVSPIQLCRPSHQSSAMLWPIVTAELTAGAMQMATGPM